MNKRLLVIGSDHGKAKELVKMLEDNQELSFISSIVYYSHCIFVPEAYLRNPNMKKHIISLQQNAYGVLMLLHAERQSRIYSPNFAKSFRIPTIGVIMGQEDEREEHRLDCQKELREAKVNMVVELACLDAKNFQYLLQQLGKIKEGNQ